MRECRLTGVIVAQIFYRMPPKSLLRFKFIQKSWDSLIHTRHFVVKHLEFQNNLTSPITIFVKRAVIPRIENGYEEIVCSLLTLRNENNGRENNLQYDIEDIHFPPSIGLKTRGQFIENPGSDPTRRCAEIVGHCNGIICPSLYSESDLVLYNPAIKEFKLIPEPCLPCDLFFYVEAFGYDPGTEDHVLVAVGSYGDELYEEERLVRKPQRAEMYKLRSDSWREIKVHNLETEASMFRPLHFQLYQRQLLRTGSRNQEGVHLMV